MHTMCSFYIDGASWPPVFNLLIVNSWAPCYSSCWVAVQSVPSGIIRSQVIPACNAHSTLLRLLTAIAHTEPSPVSSYPMWLSNMLPRHTRLFCTEFLYTSVRSAVQPPFYLCSSYRDLIFETRNKKIWNQEKNDHKTQIFAPCWEHKNKETPLSNESTNQMQQLITGLLFVV